MGFAHSPSFLQEPLRAYSARARGSFLLEKKGTKDSPKRRYPLWILLWRGTSPRELRKAKFSPPVCSANRRISSIAPATSGSRVPSSSAFTSNMQSGFQKGLAPFVKFFKLLNSKNQEVFGAPFVHFLAIRNGPRGAGAGSLPAKKVMQELSCNEQIGAYYGSNNSQLWNKPHLCQP